MGEAMDKLIAAVAAGDLTVDGAPALSMEMSGIVYAALGDDLWADCVDAFDGSLDSAVALKDALLPGWMMQIIDTYDGEVMVNLKQKCTQYTIDSTFGPSPARALLLATLRAVNEHGITRPA